MKDAPGPLSAGHHRKQKKRQQDFILFHNCMKSHAKMKRDLLAWYFLPPGSTGCPNNKASCKSKVSLSYSLWSFQYRIFFNRLRPLISRCSASLIVRQSKPFLFTPFHKTHVSHVTFLSIGTDVSAALCHKLPQSSRPAAPVVRIRIFAPFLPLSPFRP